MDCCSCYYRQGQGAKQITCNQKKRNNLSPCRGRRRTRKDWLEGDGDTNTKFQVVGIDREEKGGGGTLPCRCLLFVRGCRAYVCTSMYVCGNIENKEEGMRESAKTDCGGKQKRT